MATVKPNENEEDPLEGLKVVPGLQKLNEQEQKALDNDSKRELKKVNDEGKNAIE